MNSEIDSYETKIRRAMTMAMKSAQPGKTGGGGYQNDPIVR